MSRLHQALERARSRDGGSPPLAVPTPLREATVTDIRPTATNTNKVATALVTTVSCPKCGTATEGVRVLWLRRFLRLMHVPVYRCQFCRRRFSRFAIGSAPPPVGQGWGSAFLSPADNRSFHDVIQAMAHDERGQASQERRRADDRRAWNRERRLNDLGYPEGDRRGGSDRRIIARRSAHSPPDIVVTARQTRGGALAPFVIPQNGPRG
jgi:hypothetical protein